MSDALILAVSAEEKGERIDKFLSEKIERFSRSAAAKLIDDEAVMVNGQVVSKNYKCKENDKISVVIPEAKPLKRFLKIYLLLLFMRMMICLL